MIETMVGRWAHRGALGACIVVTFIVATAPADASAKKAAADKKPSTALVVLGVGDAAKPVVAAVEGFFTEAMRFYPEYKIIHGEAGTKKLKKAAHKCKDDVPCLARIGKRSGATEVLLAKVEPSGKGAVVSFVAISVEKNEISRSLKIQLASPDAARAALAESFFAIMGVTTPGYVKIVNAPPTVMVDGTEVSTAEGPIKLAPGAHVIVAAGEEQKAMVLPGKTRKLTFASLKPKPKEKRRKRKRKGDRDRKTAASTSASAESGTEIATADDAGSKAGATATATKTSGGSTHPLAYVGYGLAGVGVVLIAIGIGFGTQASAQVDATTTQVEAARRNEAASSNAGTANALIGVGLGVIAVGAATSLIGTFVLSTNASVTATASPEGAALAFTYRW